MLWRQLEIVVAFIALAFFAFHDYERADFLMLCLICKEEIFYRWMKFRRVWAELAKKFKEAE